MFVSRFAAAVGCILSFVLFAPSVVLANVCDAAAYRASDATGVPLDVLRTITRLETGRADAAGEPWPWTVNHAGDGTWFPSEDEARSYVFSKVKRGVSNIDIGCFQINYRWHSDAFRSLDEMFHPEKNAAYAARFLTELYREFGNWTEAAGAYHSRTPKYAERYKSKFLKVSDQIAQFEPPNDRMRIRPASAASSRKTAGSGSLFVIEARNRRPLIDFRRTNR